MGVFDSGVGGLAILREIRSVLPERSIVYLADHVFAPYGERQLSSVQRRWIAITRFLQKQGADTVVLACNSASAAELCYLRYLYPGTTFVGMEPAIRPAALDSRTGTIGVLATPATFQGELYSTVVDCYAASVRVIEATAVGLAQAIENGDDAGAEAILRVHVDALVNEGVDRIVLGCTHYTFVAGLITELAGPGVQLIDPSAAVAAQVCRVLSDTVAGLGTVTYLTTGNPPLFSRRASELLGDTVQAERVVIC